MEFVKLQMKIKIKGGGQLNRDKSEIELGVGKAKQIEGENIWKILNNNDCNYAVKHTEGFSYMKN